MLPSDDHGSYAVIDLVAHLYRGGADDRRALAGIWNRYSEATESERKSKGFELVRMHHATLTRMFRDDPDGEYLDIDDMRMAWEEFVDALRDAVGASADKGPKSPEDEKCYKTLENPVMKRSESFSKLAIDLAAATKGSPVSSPEGSTRGIHRVSSSGMILRVGCSSREPSTRGGNQFNKFVRPDELGAALGSEETSP